jgi:HEAT repeat protein
MNDTEETVRMAAMATLVSLGAPSIEPLIRALNDQSEDVQRRAALALTTIGTPAVDNLIRALGDENAGVRKSAAEILGNIGDIRAIGALVGQLVDPERQVRIKVVTALASLGDSAITPLMEVFREGDIVSQNGAMEALWMIGVSATSPLIEGLGDARTDIRKRAALLLGEIGDQRAVDALNRALMDPDMAVRREAFEALEMIKKRSS